MAPERRGEFRLIPLPGGRTRLEGRTWYTLDMAPALVWGRRADQPHPPARAGAREGTGGGLAFDRWDQLREGSQAMCRERPRREAALRSLLSAVTRRHSSWTASAR